MLRLSHHIPFDQTQEGKGSETTIGRTVLQRGESYFEDFCKEDARSSAMVSSKPRVNFTRTGFFRLPNILSIGKPSLAPTGTTSWLSWL